jgi:ABC-type uncharacterized transport system substrate-binding protein
MNHKVILFLLAASVLIFHPADAQQTGKIARIGFLDASTASASAVRLEAFWQELRNLGWIQGKNISVEYRFGEQDNKRMPELAADLVGLKVDLIVVVGTSAALALKLKLEEIEIQLDAKGLEEAFQTAKQKQVGAIVTTAGPRIFAQRKRIIELAGKYRLPAIYFQKEFVDEGGLMSYGTDYTDLFRRAAIFVDKILKGAKPADLPVQQATKFEFVINLKAAKQIGLTIPVRVLERANQVIK